MLELYTLQVENRGTAFSPCGVFLGLGNLHTSEFILSLWVWFKSWNQFPQDQAVRWWESPRSLAAAVTSVAPESEPPRCRGRAWSHRWSPVPTDGPGMLPAERLSISLLQLPEEKHWFPLTVYMQTVFAEV